MDTVLKAGTCSENIRNQAMETELSTTIGINNGVLHDQ